MTTANLNSSTEAFQRARARADIATHFLERCLHTAIYDAREAGMTIRQIAHHFQLPRRDVRRYVWRIRLEHHGRSLPMWGTPAEYIAAHEAIHGAPPDRIPYRWRTTLNGERELLTLPFSTGIARLGESSSTPDTDTKEN